MPTRTIEQTFDLESCRDLIEKLHREIERLRAAPSRQEAADFGFNCAVTAYHICDWAWRDALECPRAEDRLRREAGLADGQKLRRCHVWDAALAACNDDQRHALIASRYICNTSKHGQDDSRTTIEVYASAARPASVEASIFTIRDEPGDWVWKLIEGEDRLYAADVFETARDFWQIFVHEYGIDRLSTAHNPSLLSE